MVIEICIAILSNGKSVVDVMVDMVIGKAW